MLKKPLDLLFQVKTLDASYGYGCEIGLTNKEASSHAFWGEKRKVSKDDVAYLYITKSLSRARGLGLITHEPSKLAEKDTNITDSF